MSKKKVSSRCLVVDASVAHAAGSIESKHPTGIRCREFLMTIRSVCHRIAWTGFIKDEWNRHESAFARQWLVSMMNLGKLSPVRSSDNSEARGFVEEHCADAAIRTIMFKDCHLVDAAIASDGRIASLDEQVRSHFARMASAVEKLGSVQWVNPAVDEERVVAWLENGAPNEISRRLKKGRARKKRPSE